MNDIIRIDTDTLTDAIAGYIMDQRYPGGWQVNQVATDERSVLVVRPELETELSDLVYDLGELIYENRIDEPVDGSLGLLFTDLTPDAQQRILEHHNDTRDNLMDYLNGWVVAWIPPQ